MLFDDILNRFIEKVRDCSVFSFPNSFKIIKSGLLDSKVCLHFHCIPFLSEGSFKHVMLYSVNNKVPGL